VEDPAWYLILIMDLQCQVHLEVRLVEVVLELVDQVEWWEDKAWDLVVLEEWWVVEAQDQEDLEVWWEVQSLWWLEAVAPWEVAVHLNQELQIQCKWYMAALLPKNDSK
jgi:hypothetical protein